MTTGKRRSAKRAPASPAFRCDTPRSEFIERDRLQRMINAHLDALQTRLRALAQVIGPRVAGKPREQAEAILATEYVPAVRAAIGAQMDLLADQVSATEM